MKRIAWSLGIAAFVFLLVLGGPGPLSVIGLLALPALPAAVAGGVLGSELLGRGAPPVTAAVAGVAALPTLLVGVLVPVVLPYGLVLVACAVASGVRRGPHDALPEVIALHRALDRFAARREVLGAHYRWRLALWTAPHLALGVLLGLVALGIAVSAGLTPMLPLVVLRGLQDPLVLLLAGEAFLAAVLVAGGILAAIVGMPVSRPPVVRLLRASWAERGGAARRGGVVVPMLLFLIAGGIGLAAATGATVAAPGIAGIGAAVPTAMGLGVLSLRLTFADVAVLTSDGPVAAGSAALRLLMDRPAASARIATVWVLGVSGIAGSCLAATAAVAASVRPMLTAHLDGTVADVGFAAVVLAAFAATAYAAAPALLGLKLYRVAAEALLGAGTPAGS